MLINKVVKQGSVPKKQIRSLHILIGGGKGFIGGHLTNKLSSQGHRVTHISRKPTHGHLTWKDFEYRNIFQDMALAGHKIDAVVQLSGANIVEKPWTDDRKKELRDSRIGTTESLVKRILEIPDNIKPQSFIAGSAVGIYPDSDVNVYDETYTGPYDSTFPGQLVQDWETSSSPLEGTVTKRCVIRTGIVLGKDGGAWPKGILPFGLAYVGKFGDGTQWYPWVHIDDMVGLLEHCIMNNLSGTFNGVSPGIVTNGEYAETIKKVTERPVFTIPEFLVRLMFDTRTDMLVKGKKVVPEPNTQKSGYVHRFNTLEDAIRDLVEK